MEVGRASMRWEMTRADIAHRIRLQDVCAALGECKILPALVAQGTDRRGRTAATESPKNLDNKVEGGQTYDN